MAQKKTIKRRSSKKKGMSPLLKILIGGAVLGGGYLIYDQFFKGPTEEEKKAELDKKAADELAALQVATESDRAAAALNAIDPGTGIKAPPVTALLPDWLNPTKKDKRILSPIGTPGQRQNWGITLFKKDKGGEIETLQSLFNRVSKLYGSPLLKIDGDYGDNTEAKKRKIVGKKSGVTLAQVYKIVQKAEAKKNKPVSTDYDVFANIFPFNL